MAFVLHQWLESLQPLLMELEALLFSISVSDSARHSDQFSSIFAYQYKVDVFAFSFEKKWPKKSRKLININLIPDSAKVLSLFCTTHYFESV